MIALMLLPPGWPYNRKRSDFNRCMMNREEAFKVMAILQGEESTARMEAKNFLMANDEEDKVEEEIEYKGYPSKKEYVEDRLYSLTGDVTDIQNMSSFPSKIQDHIHQFQDTFACKLNEE